MRVVLGGDVSNPVCFIEWTDVHGGHQRQIVGDLDVPTRTVLENILQTRPEVMRWELSMAGQTPQALVLQAGETTPTELPLTGQLQNRVRALVKVADNLLTTWIQPENDRYEEEKRLSAEIDHLQNRLQKLRANRE